MVNVEALDLQIQRTLERYQRRYNISFANLAWILLRTGTDYYFKDICSRQLNGSGQNNHVDRTSSLEPTLRSLSD